MIELYFCGPDLLFMATTLPNKEGSWVLGLQGSVAKILQNPVKSDLQNQSTVLYSQFLWSAVCVKIRFYTTLLTVMHDYSIVVHDYRVPFVSKFVFT